MLQPQHAIRALDSGPALSKRTATIASVGLLHIVVLWALANGVIPTAILKTGDLAVVKIEKQKPTEVEPPPPPPPMVKPEVVQLIEPDVRITAAASEPPPITVTSATTITPPSPPSSGVPDRVAVALNIGQKPPYPTLAARMHREGKVTVKLAVLETGRVKGVTLVKSSGFNELDQAALEWVVSWKYRPAIKDGQPVASTVEEEVEFTLQDGR